MNDIHSKSPGPPVYLDILNEATRSITDHMVDYGEPAANYERASALVSLILNKPITPHEIMMIKLAVKLSRIAETPDLRKSYVELIACAALAGEFVNAGHITTKRMAAALKPPAPMPKIMPTRAWEAQEAQDQA
jgi:Domain of unknown function (DUF6378)